MRPITPAKYRFIQHKLDQSAEEVESEFGGFQGRRIAAHIDNLNSTLGDAVRTYSRARAAGNRFVMRQAFRAQQDIANMIGELARQLDRRVRIAADDDDYDVDIDELGGDTNGRGGGTQYYVVPADALQPAEPDETVGEVMGEEGELGLEEEEEGELGLEEEEEGEDELKETAGYRPLRRRRLARLRRFAPRRRIASYRPRRRLSSFRPTFISSSRLDRNVARLRRQAATLF